jgi:hypothetical protein
MKPGMTSEQNRKLHELLREWRVESTPLPPRFTEQVWQRITRSKNPDKSTTERKASMKEE